MPNRDGTGPNGTSCCGGRKDNCCHGNHQHSNRASRANSKELLEKRRDFLKSELAKVEEDLNKM